MRPGSLANRLIGPLLCLLVLAQAGAQTFNDKRPPAELANALLEQMADEEVLAQTFMFGWVGADPSPLILDWVRVRRIGGVKIFGWNTDDTLRLAGSVGMLQKAALEAPLRIPLLIATDQEGGMIRHVKGDTSQTPGNMALGAAGYPRDAYLAGYYIGRELALLGINMNFAPSVDLFTNRHSQLMGTRSFGDDPEQAAMLGAAFARGQERAGVIPTAKHFPGHGDTALDSHGILPRLSANQELLWSRELVPYRMLIREGVPAIMSGHLAFPNTPGGSAPASLSRWFLTTLLREQMGFRGLVITDDLQMVGATQTTGSVSRAARAALEAGNDILMFSRTPTFDDPVWTQLLSAYRREPAFRARVRDAARRVLTLKLDYLRRKQAPAFIPDPAETARKLPDPEAQRFFQEQAARSVSAVLGARKLPLPPKQAGRVLIAAPYADFLAIGQLAYPAAERWQFSWAPSSAEKAQAEAAELVRRARQADTIIFCLANQSGLNLLQVLRASGKQVLVLSVQSPIYLEQADWVHVALALFGSTRESFLAGFSCITGRFEPVGTVPFSLSLRNRQD